MATRGAGRHFAPRVARAMSAPSESYNWCVARTARGRRADGARGRRAARWARTRSECGTRGAIEIEKRDGDDARARGCEIARARAV